MKKLILVIPLLFLACGKIPKGSDNPMATNDNIPFNVKFFKYRTVGQCSDGSLQFKYLSGTGIIFDFDSTVTQDVRNAQIEIFLKTDNTYDARYREFLSGINTGTQTLSGKYTDSNDVISLENLGNATYTELNQSLSLTLVFEKDILTPGLANKEVVLRSILSRDGLITNEEYCQTH
jgi:hypothetical protein